MIPTTLLDFAEENIKRSTQQALFFRPGKGADWPRSAISEAERNRLVKATKSPTRPKLERTLRDSWFDSSHSTPPTPLEIDQAPHYAKNATGPGRFVVVGHRQWSNEYRIRTEVTGTVKESPPDQSGDRVTEMLTTRGARKIAESCEFMHLQRGGYTTFLTLTLDKAARARVESGATTIQREVSRFFDALKKVYSRGMDCEIDGKTVRLNGHFDALDYLWVAECPDHIDSETGEITGENPHVHVLMRYQVHYRYFEAWAKRIESLWGQGFAHLEKIKDGAKAGSYMAKAAGYLCKAQGKSDQGTIRGNRYNISASARAPDWVCVGRYELGKMGFLLSEAAEHFDETFGHLQKRRDMLKKRLTTETKNSKRRHLIGKLLEETRGELAKMPRLSKYQAILKGDEQFNQFMEWAANDTQAIGPELAYTVTVRRGKGSEAVTISEPWLPDKEAGDGFMEKPGHGQWVHQFKLRKAIRKDRRRWHSWFSDHEHYMMSLYATVAKGNIQEPELSDDNTLQDYAEYAALNVPSEISF